MEQATLKRAHQLHGAGRLAEAASICHEILDSEPHNAEALNLSAVLSFQQGDFARAADCFRQAIELCPRESSYRNNLGNVLLQLGREAEAAQAYREAIRIKPDYPQAHFNLGNVLSRQKLYGEAVAELQTAIRLKPDYAAAYNNLGSAFSSMNEGNAALAAFRAATELDPKIAGAHFNLGLALAWKLDYAGAAACYRQAIACSPDPLEPSLHLIGMCMKLEQPEAAAEAYRSAQTLQSDEARFHFALANVLSSQGLFQEAVAEHRLAIERRPDFAEAYSALAGVFLLSKQEEPAIEALRNALRIEPGLVQAHSTLGTVLEARKDLDAAEDHYRQAVLLKPDSAEALAQLSGVCKALGKIDESIEAGRASLRLDPNNHVVHSHVLYGMHYHPGYDSKAVYEEHLRWSERHAAPLRHFVCPHDNDRSPERKLRIGYVSPDFRHHCLQFMFLPLFRNHDHEKFEIYLYSNWSEPDYVTAMVQEHADVWRPVFDLSNQELADRIRADGIDILVDLALHFAHNRLLVLARKPAPVQITWLGCPGSTGLSAVDYRLTDRYLDPPGLSEAFNVEEPLLLPDSFWCYDPLTDELEVSSLPALQNGYVTFGCLNAFWKINDELLHLWARILGEVPHSRLILLAPSGRSRPRAQEIFRSHGVAADRLEFADFRPRAQYLKLYQSIDLALDPMPYNGHTTSLDSLWMGVPMVNLLGHTVMGRAGYSQLFNLGLPELVVETLDAYFDLAVALANDLPRLAELRRTIRPQMQSSPLMDAPRFARNVEGAYRTVWRRWCFAPQT